MLKSKATMTVPLALLLALSAHGLAAAQEGEPADPITSANGEVSDTLVPQDGALAVYEEHIRALNACDWPGLVAQYPNNAELHFINNSVTVGRGAIGALFDGFVAPFPNGLCGLTFTEETRLEVGGTEVVQWVADAAFLAEPHRGSDAYVTDGQYMVAMVSTFDGSQLVYTEDAQAQLDAMAAEAAAMSEAAGEVAEEQEEGADEKEEAAEAKDEKEEAKDEVADEKEEVAEEKEEAKEEVEEAKDKVNN